MPIHDEIPDPEYEDRNYPHLSEEIRGFLQMNRANTIAFREQCRREREEQQAKAKRSNKGSTAQ